MQLEALERHAWITDGRAARANAPTLAHDYLMMARAVRESVAQVALCTPLELASAASRALGNQVLIKREDLQPVHSFKLRGAYACMASMTAQERERGAICASAGNHAQGVALAGQRMGIATTIVMPCTTPLIKVEAVQALGGNTVLHGDSFDEAYTHARQLAQARNLVFVHPYDDPRVMAGQATVGLELLEQCPTPPDVVFVPCGGGGLVSGIAAVVKVLAPETKVIAVEPDDAACLFAAFESGERSVLASVGLFADGVAVRQVGEHPFAVAQHYVDAVIKVNVDEICAGVADIFRDNRSLPEAAGALALAGLKKYVEHTGVRGQTLVAIESGANLNFDRMRHIAERAELGEQREALLAVTIPECPGSFRRFCALLGRRAITEFNYRYAHASRAHVFCGVQIHGGEAEKHSLIAQLQEADFAVLDMSRNEMAKLHVRYMVGGPSEQVQDEILLRFEFPERPGALQRFLDEVGSRWNISLFHYRNHGAAYGRVLAGMQVAPAERADFYQALDRLRYEYVDETHNPAYQLFLSPQLL